MAEQTSPNPPVPTSPGQATAKVKPQILKGTRDFLPRTMLLRQHVIRTIADTFESFGFEPLETPALEYAATLEGKYGEEGEKLIYRFEDHGRREVALRYDLTVPLCRVVAMYPELPKPFKRYQMQPVWRADKPQKGRYREFWQCDVDILGSSSMLADAEIIAVLYTALSRLGFQRFTTKINHRKLLAGIGHYAGIEGEQLGAMYRAIDKLEKIGTTGVHEEMLSAGIAQNAVRKLEPLLYLTNNPRFSSNLLEAEKQDHENLLKEVFEILSESQDASREANKAIDDLMRLLSHLRDLGVDPAAYAVDFTMVRGLDYYTGPIFETVVEEPRIGSITGGGRYDNLVGIFSGRQVPATGSTIGLERIVDVMEELGLAAGRVPTTTTQVLVTIFGEELIGESLRLVGELRRAGIRSELYVGAEKLAKQLRFASKRGIPYVAILGPEEVTRGEVQVKDLRSGEQRSLPRQAIAAALRGG
ncbi:MAG: histidine--tRNA ligase [Candidatus Tectomicrobia bacterium]|nr:histidine--tRNA ligase [Candidatus Tectomicrobia bacterium]